ncbi:MAG: transglutaminaseTgpA domain-containing protein, partial [Nocardioidaceae bacterium]
MSAIIVSGSSGRRWPRPRLVELAPSRDEAVDLAGAAILVVLAVVGFRTVFNGPGFLLASIPGALAGAAIGHVLVRQRPPAIVAAAAAILGYFIVGVPFAMRTLSPTGVGSLLDGSVNGWARLLTTLPPAGQEGNLFASPFLCAYTVALFSVLLARRIVRWPVCVAPPLAGLAVSVLFGVDRPASLLLQGSAFAVATIAWVSLRDARSRRVVGHTSTARRRVGPLVLLLVAGAGAFVVGPSLPLARSRSRYVLRDVLEPPFDPRAYPSPLVAFRSFRTETAMKSTYLTASHLPRGARVRLAVLDDYDGTVWRATGAGGEAAGTYDRVGDLIPQDVPAGEPGVTREEVRLTVGALRDVWLPTVGQPIGVRFGGSRATSLLPALRFNSRADVGAVPGLELAEGDVIELDVVYAPEPRAGALASAAADPRAVLPGADGVPDTLRDLAAQHATASTPYERAQALASWLRQGFYSDGGSGAALVVPPGHSLGRLAQLLDPDRVMAGNAEQYAAAMAVLARSLGLPARVVLGFKPKKEGDNVALTGADASAWVEVAFAGKGWVAFDSTPDESRVPMPQPNSSPTLLPKEADAPPPRTPPSLDDRGDNEGKLGEPAAKEMHGFPIGAILRMAAVVLSPAAVVGSPFAFILAFKARRRRRRRSSGTPATRISAGWAELVDLARDLGRPVARPWTRPEAAIVLERSGLAGFADLAMRADASVFGRDEPGEDEAMSFWSRVDAVAAGVRSSLGRRDRFRASVSLASL